MFIFLPVLITAGTPFVMLLVPFDGLNPWAYPHILLPGGLILLLIMLLLQLGLRRRFLLYARALRENRGGVRTVFEPRS